VNVKRTAAAKSATRNAAVALLCVCLAASGCNMTGSSFNPAVEGPEPLPITPPGQADIRAAIDRGVAFLVETQRPDGGWGNYHQVLTEEVYCPPPGGPFAFLAATTSLCVSALIEADSDVPGADEALDRGVDWMIREMPKLTMCHQNLYYNNWGHAFGLQALVDILENYPLTPEREQLVREGIREQVRRLVRYQTIHGGWGYYAGPPAAVPSLNSCTSFTTATALIALHDAYKAGFEVDREKVVDRAMYAVRRPRRPDFSYGYQMRSPPTSSNTTPGASMGRVHACNLSLRLWGGEEVTDAIITAWLKRLIARNGWFVMARKTIQPHQGVWGIAGYYYYYGHYYAARCVDELLPEDERPYFQDHFAKIILSHQEDDGSWWDYPLYEYYQQYGTAFAISTLVRCLHAPEVSGAP